MAHANLIHVENSLFLRALLAILGLVAAGPGQIAAAENSPIPSLARLEVFPTSLHFADPRDTAQLVVTGFQLDGRVVDLTREARIQVSDDQIAAVQQSVIAPRNPGQCALTIAARGLSTNVSVKVARPEPSGRVSFRYGVLAALSKQGCSAGSCHGSPSGKGGLRLSLRGFDPQLDELTLVHDDFSRRVNRFDPEQSLMLLKPLMKTPHGGGLKLHTTDPAYAVLRDWIREGCRTDSSDAAVCERIEVFPKQRELHAPASDLTAWRQQLAVVAHFSDGSIRDVTPLVVFTASDPEVTKIGSAGLVSGQRRGETTVVARFLDFFDTAEFAFLQPVPGFVWSDPPAYNYIDELVNAKLQRLSIPPSGVCTDGEFLRRVYLDVLGRLPSYDETVAFLRDAASDKRLRLLDTIFEQPEYAEFWGQKWADLLRVKASRLSPAGVRKFHRWLVDAVRRNIPYDWVVRELLTAQGSTFFEPAANFYRAATDENDCAESVAQLFLGVRIQCAKCHNHPADRWSQDNYYGIGAFFSRVGRKPTSFEGEMLVFLRRTGEVTQPRTGRVVKPWLPLTGDVDVPDDQDRREWFVRWLTTKENPFFAKVAANRLWGQLLGRGIVDPVDDFHAANPPSNAPLLQALAEDFARSGFDQRRLLRTILSSRTYQLSSRDNPLNADDAKYFSHGLPRLLSAEQLLDAVCDVTGITEKYPGVLPNTRATQLPSPDLGNDFLRVFGQPLRNTVCACERGDDPKLVHALELINGPLLAGKLRDPRGHLSQWLNAPSAASPSLTDQEILTRLYVAALSRYPTERELTVAADYIRSLGDRRQGLEDLGWALLNSKEFLFQH